MLTPSSLLIVTDLIRPRRDNDIDDLFAVLAEQQPKSLYPITWPPPPRAGLRRTAGQRRGVVGRSRRARPGSSMPGQRHTSQAAHHPAGEVGFPSPGTWCALRRSATRRGVRHSPTRLTHWASGYDSRTTK